MILGEIPSSAQVGFPLLTVLLLLPALGALAVWLIRDRHTAYQVGLWVAMIELVLTGVLMLLFVPGVPDMQFVERGPSIPALGLGYVVGVDGLSVLFLPIIALLAVLVIGYAEKTATEDVAGYVSAMLAFESTMIGAFISIDLLLFWLVFVLEMVPSYLLITRWGTGPLQREAGRHYVMAMSVGAVLMLAGILTLAWNHATFGDGQRGPSFDLLELLTVPVPLAVQTVAFFALFFGFAIKAPVFPFHTWLPKVLEHGPIVGAGVFLVGIKLGTYGFIRFVIPLLPEASREWFWLMAAFGGAGIVYGALIALAQTDLRRMLAFGSLSHMGVVMLGLFSLNFAGLQGGLLQMINLGITGAGLFFLAGFLHTRIGRPDLKQMGGLLHLVPVLTALFLLITISGIGLPGTNGFNGEHLVVLGGLEVHWLIAVIAGLGTFLTAAYMLRFFQRAFMGPVNPSLRPDIPDLRVREVAIAVPLIVLILWIGLYTTPFVRTIEGSLRALEQRIERGSFAGAQPGDVVTIEAEAHP